MGNFKYDKGTAIGGIIGALLTLGLIKHKGNAPYGFLFSLLIMFLPWGAASLGKYVQRKYFSKQTDIKSDFDSKK